MTWEIVVGIFTLASAFISALTAAVKVNRAIVLLEEAVKRLDGREKNQERLNERLSEELAELERRVIRLESNVQN